jgi:hypothetical protein
MDSILDRRYDVNNKIILYNLENTIIIRLWIIPAIDLYLIDYTNLDKSLHLLKWTEIWFCLKKYSSYTISNYWSHNLSSEIVEILQLAIKFCVRIIIFLDNGTPLRWATIFEATTAAYSTYPSWDLHILVKKSQSKLQSAVSPLFTEYKKRWWSADI